jgi:hypothetical protein
MPRGPYDPNQTDVIIDGDRLEGFGPSSFFGMEHDADDNTLAMGVDDTGTVEIIRNSGATFTITTKYGSAATRRLWRIRNDGIRNNTIVAFNLEFFDRVSGSRMGGARSWIQAPPSLDFGAETPDLEWTLRTDKKTIELNELPEL